LKQSFETWQVRFIKSGAWFGQLVAFQAAENVAITGFWARPPYFGKG